MLEFLSLEQSCDDQWSKYWWNKNVWAFGIDMSNAMDTFLKNTWLAIHLCVHCNYFNFIYMQAFQTSKSYGILKKIVNHRSIMCCVRKHLHASQKVFCATAITVSDLFKMHQCRFATFNHFFFLISSRLWRLQWWITLWTKYKMRVRPIWVWQRTMYSTSMDLWWSLSLKSTLSIESFCIVSNFQWRTFDFFLVKTGDDDCQDYSDEVNCTAKLS